MRCFLIVWHPSDLWYLSFAGSSNQRRLSSDHHPKASLCAWPFGSCNSAQSLSRHWIWTESCVSWKSAECQKNASLLYINFCGCDWVGFVSRLKCISTHLEDGRGGEEAGKSRIGVNYGQLANSVFCRMCIVIVFSSFQWRSCSFQPSRATFARLISGVSCLRAEWRPQPAQPTLRYGATRLMACMCLTGTTPVAASVWNASRAAERAAAVHGWGSSFPNDLQFYDRQAQGGWNLVSLEVCLERFLCFCLGGLMRSADLRI